MAKMNPEAKTKVVEALRSGKYKQGAGYLRRGDCFCVWGVICDVSEIGAWVPDLGELYRYEDGIDQSDRRWQRWFGPAHSVKNWVGLDDYDSHVEINGIVDTLMDHSDYGVAFAELADAIEEQL
jgi:hypothetical protein